MVRGQNKYDNVGPDSGTKKKKKNVTIAKKKKQLLTLNDRNDVIFVLSFPGNEKTTQIYRHFFRIAVIKLNYNITVSFFEQHREYYFEMSSAR